jgi:zona occludens toxin
MTISAYTGLPGHGKSYGVVDNVIKPALEIKRVIYTNIPLNLDIILEKYNAEVIQFSTQDILDNDNWFQETFSSGALIIIDEVWRLWPSGLKASNVLQQHKEFLAEHRHLVGDDGMSTEIVLVTQDLSQIAAFARTLVENTFHVNKLEQIGKKKAYRVDVYYGSVTGVSPPKSKRHREIFGVFKQDIFDLYQSHTKSKTGSAGNEQRVDKRFSRLSGTLPKVYLISMIVFSIIAYYGISNVFSTYGVSDLDKESETISTNKKHNALPANLSKTINKKQTNQQSSFDMIQLQQQQEIEALKNEIESLKLKREKDLLTNSKQIEIAFNNGVYPKIEYVFRIIFSDTDIDLNQKTLESLGYKIRSISSCLVEIENDTFHTYAKCKRDDTNKGFFNELTNIKKI